MRRPRRKLEVNTFPFLAVLLCAMGAFILLLMVVNRRSKIVAQNKAHDAYLARKFAQESDRETAVKDRDAKMKANWQVQKDKIHAELKAEEDALSRQITTVLAALAKTDDAIENRKLSAVELARKVSLEDVALQALQKELLARKDQFDRVRQTSQGHLKLREQLTRDLVLLETALRSVQERKSNQRAVFSLVPYKGKHGSAAKPVYIEVSDGGVAVHPGPTTLTTAALSPDTLRRAVEERTGPLAREIARQPGTPFPEKSDSPYLLFLVRPSGVQNYYLALQSLRDYQVDFGYELIEADWAFDFSNDKIDQQPWRQVAKVELEPAHVTRAAPKGMGPRVLGGGGAPIGFPDGGEISEGVPPGAGRAGGSGGFPGGGNVPGGGPNPFATGQPGGGIGSPGGLGGTGKYPGGSGTGQGSGGPGNYPGGLPGGPGNPLAGGQPGNGVPGGTGVGQGYGGTGNYPGGGNFPGGPGNPLANGQPGSGVPGGTGVGQGSGRPGNYPGGGNLPGGPGNPLANGQPGTGTEQAPGVPGNDPGGAAYPGGPSLPANGPPGIANGNSGAGQGSGGSGYGPGGDSNPGGPANSQAYPALTNPNSIASLGLPEGTFPGGAAGARPGSPNPYPGGEPGTFSVPVEGSTANANGPQRTAPAPQTPSPDDPLTFRKVNRPTQTANAPPRYDANSGASGSAGFGRPRSPDDGEPGEPGPSVGQSPFLPAGRPAPGPRLPALGRIVGNRDFVMTVECFERSVSLSPPGRTFDLNDPEAIEKLAAVVKTLVAGRQRTVRPGEPPFRPIVQFRVQPDGRRTYYSVYPRLAEFGFAMSRESAD